MRYNENLQILSTAWSFRRISNILPAPRMDKSGRVSTDGSAEGF
jgi:hypothetical protein